MSGLNPPPPPNKLVPKLNNEPKKLPPVSPPIACRCANKAFCFEISSVCNLRPANFNPSLINISI
jgi:hypothetical protein